MSTKVLIHKLITPAIRDALQLPEGTWQLVFNNGLTAASYMDGGYHVHHLDIDDLKRQKLQRAFVDREQAAARIGSFETTDQ